MGQIKALSVAIVGGGAGCKAIMDMIFAEKLRQLQMKLVGVACTNPQAVGYCYAQEKGIYTTRDYRDLYKLKDLNMIIELTGREEVANEISRTKPDHIRLMDHVAAQVFWDVFQIEEERLAECKRAEQAIELVYAELDQIFETAAGGMCVIDKDFNVLRINQTFLTLLGLSKGEAVGKKCHEVLRGPLCHTPECTLTQILGGKERVECEVEKERKDGTRISCIVTATSLRGPDGKLIGIVEDFRDITKRLRAEKELREQQNLFKTILAATPDFLVLKDRDSVYQAVNPAFCQFIGKKEKEIIGKTDLDLFPRSEAEMYRRDDARVMETRTPQVQDEEVTGTKGKRWLQVAKTPVLDETGKAVGILCSIRDISDRKRAEAEKQKLQTQFQQAQKLEAIGTLAGGIAHDFNNLLMGIQGNVSLMAMDIDPTHPHYERLKNIEKQVQSGARLTSHLLGYARKGRYELKPIDLNQLVEESSETFGRTNKGITIHQKLARDLFPIEADPGQIEQVLLNLYVNAADAMHGSGDLILKTMNTTHKDMKRKLYDPKPGNYVLLTVTDTGIGMDRETMDRIFDPFFTTKEMGQGTGLGLASAYGIIKGHGGYIDVESKKGQGTTFSIYLPASEKKIQKAIKRAERFIRGTGTVLLVDDEEVILEIGQELLEAMGYRVLIARDGKEAVEVYKENRDDIDIVVLDMVMPNMGGGEAYDRMKEINPDAKVLLSSGFSIDGEASEILARGCDGFIQKPFNMTELSRRIRELLDKG